MKLLDSNNITGNMQKFVEAADGYVVNGHYYDKTSLVVKPFKLIPTQASIYDLGMSQRVALNHTMTHNQKTKGDTIVVDRYDPTITYIYTTDIRNNTHTAIKLKENNGAVDVIKSNVLGAWPTTNPMLRQYCGQDSNYVYYIMSTITWHEYFVKMDKITLACTVIEDMSTYCWSSSLKETDTHIYYARKNRYGNTVVKRYNKVTAAPLEILPCTAHTSNIDFTTCFSDPLTISDSEMYSFSVYHNQTSNKYAITRYKFDTTQTTLANILTEADPAITWGTSVTQFPVFSGNENVHYEPFITKTDDGKIYVNVAIYEIQASSTVANIPGYGIYTFLLDNTANTLIFKNFSTVSTDYFRNFIGVRNNNFLICTTTSTCIFMNFNKVTEAFEITDTLANQPYHIGIDQSENIFILNSLTEVEYLNPYVPTSVNIKSEQASYKYDGVDIPTYCTLNCQNFSGTYIAANIQLVIKGPGVFASTKTKTITATTLTTGDLQIPMIVQGGSPITIQPSYIM